MVEDGAAVLTSDFDVVPATVNCLFTALIEATVTDERSYEESKPVIVMTSPLARLCVALVVYV